MKKLTEEQENCDHDWKFRDDSFSHEFGVERIVYEECDKCSLTRPVQPRDDYE